MSKQSALRKMAISNLALLYEGRGKRIEELEAQIKHKDEVMLKQTKLNTRVINEKMALEDGLRDVGEVHDSWNASDEFKKGWAECREQFRALLGKENDDG